MSHNAMQWCKWTFTCSAFGRSLVFFYICSQMILCYLLCPGWAGGGPPASLAYRAPPAAGVAGAVFPPAPAPGCVLYITRKFSPPTAGFFLAPAEGWRALRAQRWFWRTNGRTDGRMDGQANERTNGRTDGQANRLTDGRTTGSRELDITLLYYSIGVYYIPYTPIIL